MGLKTTNYVSKSTGLTLPEAYAVLTNLIIETDNRARAIFAIQASRENAKNFKAIDKVEIYFTWDRKSNPVVMAYETAKAETREAETYDEETHTALAVIEHGTLYGWQDDIV